MERIVHKSKSFKEAEKWDRIQQAVMTPQERIRAVRVLQQKVFAGGEGWRSHWRMIREHISIDSFT